MRISVFAFVFLGILSHCLGQEVSFRPYHKGFRVIAKSGLNLRAKPNTRSQIITKIPQMELVKLHHKDTYGLEKFEEINTEIGKYKVEGYWLKVQYQEYVGFVNTAYLIPHWHYVEQEQTPEWDSINNEWVILIPGSDCAQNVYPYQQYQWFGLYESADSSFRFEPIEFEFFCDLDEMQNFHIVAQRDKDLRYIIGHKQNRMALAQGINTGKIAAYVKQNPNDTLETTWTQNFIEVTSKASRKENRKGEEYFSLEYCNVFLVQDRRKQLISEFGAMIYWSGDINGDGIRDYILSSGEYTIELWIGTNAESTIAEKKAVYFGAPCC